MRSIPHIRATPGQKPDERPRAGPTARYPAVCVAVPTAYGLVVPAPPTDVGPRPLRRKAELRVQGRRLPSVGPRSFAALRAIEPPRLPARRAATDADVAGVPGVPKAPTKVVRRRAPGESAASLAHAPARTQGVGEGQRHVPAGPAAAPRPDRPGTDPAKPGAALATTSTAIRAPSELERLFQGQPDTLPPIELKAHGRPTQPPVESTLDVRPTPPPAVGPLRDRAGDAGPLSGVRAGRQDPEAA